MSNKLAPILLITYNRQIHFQKTLSALSKNDKAKESILFISIDGPKNIDDEKSQDIILSQIELASGSFAEINVLKNKTNKGLKKNITDSVSKILSSHNKVIVLEDDLITSRAFISFMNDALNYYQDKKKVWHISGCSGIINNENKKNEIFLSRYMCCWGWATWSDRWIEFNKNTTILINKFSKERIFKFNIDGAINFWDQIIENKIGKINTWAVFWYFTIFSKDGLCVIPWFGYVKNIGFDESGTNCKNIKSPVDLSKINHDGRFIGISNLKEDQNALNLIKKSNKRSYIKTFLVTNLNNVIGYYNVYKVKTFLKKIKNNLFLIK